MHEALIERTHEDRLVDHISRDATAIEAREKPVKTVAPERRPSIDLPTRILHPKANIRGRMAPGGSKIAASLGGRSRSLLVSKTSRMVIPTFCCSPEVADLRAIEPSYKQSRCGITFRWRPVRKLLIELRLIGTWLHFQNDRRG
jgi:hypothetical protein